MCHGLIRPVSSTLLPLLKHWLTTSAWSTGSLCPHAPPQKPMSSVSSGVWCSFNTMYLAFLGLVLQSPGIKFTSK